MLLQIGIIACLLFLFYQDLRYRAVYWLIFPVLVLLLVAFTLTKSISGSFLLNSGLNLGFVFVQLLLLSLYFSIRNKRWVDITREYLGWGDVLFLICIAFYLSPLNYLLFYICSLLLVLLVSAASIWKRGAGEYKIPLAGLQALLFAVLVFTDWNTNQLNLQSDDWLITHLAV